MRAVQTDWEALLKNTDAILASEQTVLSLHQVAATLAETVPQLQIESEKVVDSLLQRGAPASQVALAQRQSLLAERILGAVNTVLAGMKPRCRPPMLSAAMPTVLAWCSMACSTATRAAYHPGRRPGRPGAAGGHCRAVRICLRLRG